MRRRLLKGGIARTVRAHCAFASLPKGPLLKGGIFRQHYPRRWPSAKVEWRRRSRGSRRDLIRGIGDKRVSISVLTHQIR